MGNKNIKFYRKYFSLVLLAVIGLGLLLWFTAGDEVTKKPDDGAAERAKLLADIETKVRALVSEKAKYIKVADVAETVRNNIMEGMFSAAEQTIPEVYANSRKGLWDFEPYTSLIESIQTNADGKYERRLREWIEIDQSNPLPWLLRAQYFYEIAWLVRDNKIDKEKVTSIRLLMVMAEQDVATAIQLEPKNRYARYLQLLILNGQGISAELSEAFNRSIEIMPAYYPIYSVRLSTLLPEWGGSFKAMYDFVDTYAGKATSGSPLGMLYLELYEKLLGLTSNHCQQEREDVRDTCVTAIMGKIVTPELFQNITETITAYSSVDRWDYSKEIGLILQSMVMVPNGGHFSGVILQLVAESMGSNPELTPDRIANNNYMVDRVVGLTWLKRENYAAAETMLLRAVEDLDNIEAPDDEHRDYERAMIYDNLARVYYGKKSYADSVVYLKAADYLAGASRESADSALQCYALHEMKLYEEAIWACTVEVERKVDFDSLFWRARAHLALGDEQKALEDYRLVAETDGRYRPYAALGIEHIYSKRGEFEKMVEVLENYTFLYDERVTSKKLIATAYNNLCYGKKALGLYYEALDDCNSSLKYGQIPDAYQKQRHLVEILKRIEQESGREGQDNSV